MTPALTISSLNFPMAARSSSLGITPASESLVALTINMKRMFISFKFEAFDPNPSRMAALTQDSRWAPRKIDNKIRWGKNILLQANLGRMLKEFLVVGIVTFGEAAERSRHGDHRRGAKPVALSGQEHA